MDTNTTLFSTGGIPALVSTAITIIYFTGKFLFYIINASTREAEGRKRTLHSGASTYYKGTESGTEGQNKIGDTIQGHDYQATHDGRGQQSRSAGTVFLPEGRQDPRISLDRNAPGDSAMPLLRRNVEGLRHPRYPDSAERFNARPPGAYPYPTAISTECQGWQDASYAKSQSAEGDGGLDDWTEQPTQICHDAVPHSPTSQQNRHTSTKTQVSETMIQTESWNTLYVMKDNLVAYTIAIVQNTQTLHFEQMQVALQTAQNQASLETLQKVENLMSAHLDLAFLPDTKDSHSVVNASAVETGAAEPKSATFRPEEETLCKSSHPNSRAAKCDRNPQPTGAVFPTCRAEVGPVRGIPAGYESDDSWDISDAADQDCSRCQNITTLVAYPSRVR